MNDNILSESVFIWDKLHIPLLVRNSRGCIDIAAPPARPSADQGWQAVPGCHRQQDMIRPKIETTFSCTQREIMSQIRSYLRPYHVNMWCGRELEGLRYFFCLLLWSVDALFEKWLSVTRETKFLTFCLEFQRTKNKQNQRVQLYIEIRKDLIYFKIWWFSTVGTKLFCSWWHWVFINVLKRRQWWLQQLGSQQVEPITRYLTLWKDFMEIILILLSAKIAKVELISLFIFYF